MHENGNGSMPAANTSPGAPSATGNGQERPVAETLGHDNWYDIVDGYVDEAHVKKSDLSTMFIDIDALKAANDEFGHEAGNQLIDLVNRIITEGVRVENDRLHPNRKADVVTSHPTELRDLDKVIPGIEAPEPQATRIDGDEFGILLPDTNREGANALAARLRETLAEELAKPENQHLADVGAGISIGIATLEPGMETADFLRQADQAMYLNKLQQLRPLSPEEETSFRKAIQHLEEAGVRPRDVPKYIQLLGASAVVNAIENRADPEADESGEPAES